MKDEMIKTMYNRLMTSVGSAPPLAGYLDVVKNCLGCLRYPSTEDEALYFKSVKLAYYVDRNNPKKFYEHLAMFLNEDGVKLTLGDMMPASDQALAYMKALY